MPPPPQMGGGEGQCSAPFAADAAPAAPDLHQLLQRLVPDAAQAAAHGAARARTAGAAAELAARFVGCSGEPPRSTRPAPPYYSFAVLPRSNPKPHVVDGVGRYLRSAPEREWEAPVLARQPGQFPSTTRNVTYGEVLCEMIGIEATLAEAASALNVKADDVPYPFEWLPTNAIGRGHQYRSERRLLLALHPACIATALAEADAGVRYNATVEHVLCGGCARRPDEAAPHFHILVVADAGIAAGEQVVMTRCVAPSRADALLWGREDGACDEGAYDDESSDGGGSDYDADGDGAPRRRRSRRPAPPGDAGGGSASDADADDDEGASDTAHPRVRPQRREAVPRPPVPVPGGCGCDCGCAHTYSCHASRWKLRPGVPATHQPAADTVLCSVCYRPWIQYAQRAAPDAAGEWPRKRPCRRQFCVMNRCKYCDKGKEAAAGGAAGADAAPEPRGVKRAAEGPPEEGPAQPAAEHIGGSFQQQLELYLPSQAAPPAAAPAAGPSPVVTPVPEAAPAPPAPSPAPQAPPAPAPAALLPPPPPALLPPPAADASASILEAIGMLNSAASSFAAAGNAVFARRAEDEVARLQALAEDAKQDAEFVVEIAAQTALVEVAQEAFDRAQPHQKPAKEAALKRGKEALRGIQDDRAAFLAAM